MRQPSPLICPLVSFLTPFVDLLRLLHCEVVDYVKRLSTMMIFVETDFLCRLKGFDFAYRSVKATMKHQNLEFWRDFVWLKQNSWTTETRPMNQRFVFTADPANIKALLATQFVDFGKGEPFHQEWKEFLGDSIFTTDGQQWHDSRQLIRPQFTRDRVSDLHCFESHVQTFFKTVANGGPLQGEHQDVDLSMANGRVVDVRDLFFRLTLDVTTEFLLGHDVKSLS